MQKNKLSLQTISSPLACLDFYTDVCSIKTLLPWYALIRQLQATKVSPFARLTIWMPRYRPAKGHAVMTSTFSTTTTATTTTPTRLPRRRVVNEYEYRYCLCKCNDYQYEQRVVHTHTTALTASGSRSSSKSPYARKLVLGSRFK